MNRCLGLCLVAVGLTVMACAQPQAAPATSAGDTAKFGGTLNTVGDDFTDFDVAYQGRSSPNVEDHALVYDRLVAFRKGPGVDFISQILVPELAERWEISPDARTFTYYLRPGVKWANVPPVNGREFTAADVKWSLEYYSRTGEYKDKGLPATTVGEMYEGLEGIDTPDRNTVRVRFKEPFAPFINYSASQRMPIAARETFKADAKPPRIDTLAGTGPYIMDTKETLKDNRWVFTKNPNYWGGPEKLYLDSIRRLIIPDVSTRIAAFQVKQLDILTASGDPKAIQEIRQANLQAVVSESLSPGQNLIFTSQLRQGPLRDIRVRRAIALAMDRDEYNNLLTGGKGQWAFTGSWPGLFTEAEVKERVKYDPEQAKKLLAEAGYASGLRLEHIPTTVGVPEQLIQAQLKRVGIDLYFTVLPREQNRARLYVGDYDTFYPGGAGIGDADFDSWLYSFHSDAGQNWAVIKDPELDKLILAQRREPDTAKRREAQRAAILRIYEMAWSPAYAFTLVTQFWHPYVKNYAPHWTTGQKDAFVWLDK